MTLEEFTEKIQEQCLVEGISCEAWNNNDTVYIEIEYGDWKHSHLRAKEIAKVLAKKAGLLIRQIDENVTLDTGEDVYSAIHMIYFNTK